MLQATFLAYLLPLLNNSSNKQRQGINNPQQPNLYTVLVRHHPWVHRILLILRTKHHPL